MLTRPFFKHALQSDITEEEADALKTRQTKARSGLKSGASKDGGGERKARY